MRLLHSKKVLFIILAAVVVLLIGMKSLQSSNNKVPVSATSTNIELLQQDVLNIHKTDLQSKVYFSGETRPSLEGVVSAPISGFIKNVHVDVGESVKKGDLLIQFIDTRYKAEYEDKKSQLAASIVLLKEAQQKLTYNENLYAKESTSNESVRQARFSVQHQEQLVKSLEAQTYLAKRMYDQTSLYSPIDGVISWREVEIGQSISEGKNLLKVVNVSQLDIIADIQANDIHQIKVGQLVQITPPNISDIVVQGRVERISPSAKDITRVYSVYIKIDKPNEYLQSGMFVEGVIIVDEQQSVFVINKKWLSQVNNIDNSAFVFVATNGFIKSQKITIQPAHNNAADYLILNGINENDIVLNPNLSQVVADQAISIRAE